MSDEDLRDFFPLPKVVEGIFKLFEELFNVKCQQIEGDFPKWHEDLTLFAVQDVGSRRGCGKKQWPLKKPNSKVAASNATF